MSTNKLSQKDILEFYDILLYYESVASVNYGKYDWEHVKNHNFIKENDIQIKCTSKNCKVNHFRFETHQDKRFGNKNDTVCHLLRHIRNAFAHGKIRKVSGNFFEIEDFRIKKDGTIEKTMTAKIKPNFLWVIIDILKESLQQ